MPNSTLSLLRLHLPVLLDILDMLRLRKGVYRTLGEFHTIVFRNVSISPVELFVNDNETTWGVLRKSVDDCEVMNDLAALVLRLLLGPETIV